jgi:hypothetical protein
VVFRVVVGRVCGRLDGGRPEKEFAMRRLNATDLKAVGLGPAAVVGVPVCRQ